MLYLRFVTGRIEPQSGRRQGLFAAYKDLTKGDVLSKQDFDYLRAERVWFNEFLPNPNRFCLSRKPNKLNQGLSWYKETAGEQIERMRNFAFMLEQYGVPFETITSNNPGYILYEDAYQVVAYPFRSTGA